MEAQLRYSRRTFVAWVGGAGAGFYLFGRLPGLSAPVALAQIPGGTLDPDDVAKFVTPLLIPPVMPRADTITQRGGKNVDYYEISMRQFEQQILPAGLPQTTVWGYGAKSAQSKRGLLVHNAPSLTIEAMWNRPVRVKWINELVDASGNYLPHLLPVDPTLHWANPPGGPMHRDTPPDVRRDAWSVHGARPDRDARARRGGSRRRQRRLCGGLVPAGRAEHPRGLRDRGHVVRLLRRQGRRRLRRRVGPGFATFQYPNENRASTIWYHDHALGMTRLNVYAGPAGFYLIRGGPAGDDEVIDTRNGRPATLPGPAPRENDKFPPNKPYREIPIAIQDRSFNADGSLFYPDTREFFDEIVRDYIPEGEFSPIWNPEFFGNMIMVNGNTWPFLTVEQRRYRFRFLNGCQSRFLILDFAQIPGVEVWQIGNEGGFLAAPVNLTADHDNRLLMGLAERADVIVDFTNVPAGKYVLGNLGPDEPFGGGIPDDDFDLADPGSTGQIMQFDVVPAVDVDDSTPPQFLQLPAITPLPAATHHAAAGADREDGHGPRRGGERGRGPRRGAARHCRRRRRRRELWMEPVSENPAVGTTEVWEFYNTTGDAHPMHVHEVVFEVVNREGLVLEDDGGGRADPARRGDHPAGALGDRLQGHGDRLSGPGDARQGALRQAGPVRLALPHRRARGQRDDAALSHRTGPAGPARRLKPAPASQAGHSPWTPGEGRPRGGLS